MSEDEDYEDYKGCTEEELFKTIEDKTIFWCFNGSDLIPLLLIDYNCEVNKVGVRKTWKFKDLENNTQNVMSLDGVVEFNTIISTDKIKVVQGFKDKYEGWYLNYKEDSKKEEKRYLRYIHLTELYDRLTDMYPEVFV